ncbi:MAG TPA: 4-(cytidine 5'-diphospho)-2-C-methyl-D-erythritol kinase [Pyrinomonadaceae bacterium]
MSDFLLKLPSFAKINWVLRVLGRRSDGLHELRTIFQTVTLQDQLKFSSRDDGLIKLACQAQGIPLDESNLIHRAANALRQRYAVKQGAFIHLEKHIPAQGGLGGGSSNAAIALLGLAYLWDIKTSKRELTEICAGLGADVPFFLTGGTALGKGLGTEVWPLAEVTRDSLLIVTPNAAVSTAEAYKALNAPALTKADSDIILSISCAEAQIVDSLPSGLHNDFERVVLRSNREIERAREALLDAGAAGALLSGSGSSVFGIFDKREEQERAAGLLKAETGWLVFPCRTLSRAEYWRALGPCAAPLRDADG